MVPAMVLWPCLAKLMTVSLPLPHVTCASNRARVGQLVVAIAERYEAADRSRIGKHVNARATSDTTSNRARVSESVSAAAEVYRPTERAGIRHLVDAEPVLIMDRVAQSR